VYFGYDEPAGVYLGVIRDSDGFLWFECGSAGNAAIRGLAPDFGYSLTRATLRHHSLGA
jgi:hypothetical protein